MVIKKKAALGITLLAVYFIADALFQLYAKTLKPGYYSWYSSVFWPLSEKAILYRYLLSIIFRIFELTAGVGVLLRKEAFRRLIVFMSWFTILTVYWKHPFNAVERHTEIVVQNLYQLNSFNAQAFVLSPNMIALISLGCLYLFDIGVSLLAIYYFTKPRIRGEFK